MNMGQLIALKAKRLERIINFDAMNIDELNEYIIEKNCVVSIHLDIDKKSCKYSLLMRIASFENMNEPLTLHFEDVSNFNLSDIGGGLTQFMHLKISKLSGGMERLNYRIEELENSLISFDFVSIDITVHSTDQSSCL